MKYEKEKKEVQLKEKNDKKRKRSTEKVQKENDVEIKRKMEKEIEEKTYRYIGETNRSAIEGFERHGARQPPLETRHTKAYAQPK